VDAELAWRPISLSHFSIFALTLTWIPCPWPLPGPGHVCRPRLWLRLGFRPWLQFGLGCGFIFRHRLRTRLKYGHGLLLASFETDSGPGSPKLHPRLPSRLGSISRLVYNLDFVIVVVVFALRCMQRAIAWVASNFMHTLCLRCTSPTLRMTSLCSLSTGIASLHYALHKAQSNERYNYNKQQTINYYK